MTKILIICGGAGRGLLGQREALGFAAELQIDVQNELVDTGTDQLAFRIPIDLPVPTTLTLLNYMVERWGNDSTKAQGRHALVINEGYKIIKDLDTGLNQNPAIGGGAIRHYQNDQTVRSKISKIIQLVGQDLGARNPLEVWIISSTAGGTGAGIRRQVGRIIAEEVDNLGRDCTIKLHYLLYGARTYTSIAARRTGLNTFMSVVQDAAFLHIEAGGLRGQHGTYVPYYYYLEIPDTGDGLDSPKREREELVQITAKAVFLEEVHQSLVGLANNVKNNTAFVRAGYWGGELPKNQLYYETLKQLRDKLDELINPSPDKFTKGLKCEFKPDRNLEETKRDITKVELLSHMDWKFPPRPSPLDWVYFRNRLSDEEYISKCESALKRLLESMPKAIDLNLLAGIWTPSKQDHTESGQADLSKGYYIEKQGSTESNQFGLSEGTDMEKLESERAGLERKLTYQEPESNISWEQKERLIWEGQRVIAWCDKLLEKPDSGLSLRKQQLEAARRCSDAQYKWFSGPSKKASMLAEDDNLPDSLELTVRIRTLDYLKKQWKHIIDELLAPALQVKARVEQQESYLKDRGGVFDAPPLVIAANLRDILDQPNQRSWIEILHHAVQSKSDEQFEKSVISGAGGLTKTGLAKVIGIESDDITDIRQRVLSKAGEMNINNKAVEGMWWQANPGIENVAYQRYNYRIFPPLETGDWKELNKDTGRVTFLKTTVGAIGMKVLAMDMLNIGEDDYSAASENLLRPMKSCIDQELDSKAWPNDNKPINQDKTTGVFNVAAAGVGGEPLNAEPLRRIGLTEDDLMKLSHLFDIFPQLEAKKVE